MEDRERRGAQAPERCIVVEVAGQWNDAMGPQPGGISGAADESVEPDPATQQQCYTQRDIAASDHQDSNHRRTLITSVP